MKTNAPKAATWLIGTIVGVLGIAGHFGVITGLAASSSWFIMAGFVILALASVMKGL